MKTSNKILWTGAALFALLYATAIAKQMRRYREANPYAEELFHAAGSGRIRVVEIEGDIEDNFFLNRIGIDSKHAWLHLKDTPTPDNARIAGDTLYLNSGAIGSIAVPGAVFLHEGVPMQPSSVDRQTIEQAKEVVPESVTHRDY